MKKDLIEELNFKLRVKKLIEDFQYMLNLGDTQGESRKHEKTIARQVLIYFIRINTTLTLEDIAKFFNKRDHSTIKHSIKKIENYLSWGFETPDSKNVKNYLKHCKGLWECSIKKP